MRGARCPALAGLVFVCTLAVFAAHSRAHIDAVRESLSQLFLQSDVVVLARIDAVADRAVPDGEGSVVFEVVTATVIEPFKGDPPLQIHVYPDAHGPAHYRAGDTAALFLERPAAQHTLHKFVAKGELDYISRQVRNTEHVVTDAWLADYRWVLDQYARSGKSDAPAAGARQPMLRQPVLRQRRLSLGTLRGSSACCCACWSPTHRRWSNPHSSTGRPPACASPRRAWSDWSASPGLRINPSTSGCLSCAPSPVRNWSGRLPGIRCLTRPGIAELVAVVRSTQGFEDRHFQPRLQGLLDRDDEALVEVAARALGHPAYAGSEPALGTLLDSVELRLELCRGRRTGRHSQSARHSDPAA